MFPVEKINAEPVSGDHRVEAYDATALPALGSGTEFFKMGFPPFGSL